MQSRRPSHPCDGAPFRQTLLERSQDRVDFCVAGVVEVPVCRLAEVERGTAAFVLQVGIGSMVEEAADAPWPAVLGCDAQGLQSVRVVYGVDRGSCQNELVESLEALMVCGSRQRADPILHGCLCGVSHPVTSPAAAAS